MLTDRFLYLRFLLRGPGSEKVLNALKKADVPLRRITRNADRSVTFLCLKCHQSQLQTAAEQFSCTLSSLTPPPFSRLLLALHQRKWFCLGFFLAGAIIFYAMQHVWQVRIVNAGPYEGDIRACLEAQEIIPGIMKRDVPLDTIESMLTYRYPELFRIRADISGVVLRILVIPGIKTPEIETAGPTGDVVASQDGIVESIITFAGTPAVKAGDFVRKGDVLIRGEEQQLGGSTHPVRARGQVSARVYIERNVRISASETETIPTGSTFSRTVLYTPLGAFTFYPSPAYENADVSSTHMPIGGTWLPLFAARETYEEVTLSSVPRDEASLRLECQKALANLLDSALQSGDVVVDKWVDYSMIEMESYAAVCVAQIRRDIGRFSPHGN